MRYVAILAFIGFCIAVSIAGATPPEHPRARNDR